MTLLSSIGRARGYCNGYEDEDELVLNSAQYARSAASRPDDVIILDHRSALEQAREGLGGRDMGLGHSFFTSNSRLLSSEASPNQVIKFNA